MTRVESGSGSSRGRVGVMLGSSWGRVVVVWNPGLGYGSNRGRVGIFFERVLDQRWTQRNINNHKSNSRLADAGMALD